MKAWMWVVWLAACAESDAIRSDAIPSDATGGEVGRDDVTAADVIGDARDAADDTTRDADTSVPDLEPQDSEPQDAELDQDAESSEQDAETSTQDAESSEQDAESSAQDSESPEQDSESSTQDSESSTQDSESSTQDAESSTQDSESSTHDSESSTQDSESSEQDSESSTQDSESSTQDSESPEQDSESADADAADAHAPDADDVAEVDDALTLDSTEVDDTLALDATEVPDTHAPDLAPEVLAPLPTLEIAVTPAEPRSDQDLTAVLVAPSPLGALTLTWRWALVGSSRIWIQPTLPATQLTRGDTWELSATLADAHGQSRTATTRVTIRSTPPRVGGVVVNGRSYCEAFVCEARNVSDHDRESVTLAYRWWVDDVLVAATGSTLSAPAGARVACAVTPSDPSTTGDEVRSGPVIALDLAPSVTVTLTDHARAGDVVRCAARASDDCSSPTITYAWTVNGVATADTGPTYSTATLATGDVLTCHASASDGTNVTTIASTPLALASSTLVITADAPRGFAGYAVSVIDDQDGDGLAEIAIGAPNTSLEHLPQAGAIYVVRGREDVDRLDLGALADPTLAPDAALGHYLPGDRGGFDVALMACSSVIVVGGCPTLRDVGDLSVDYEGPQGAGLGFALAEAGDLDGDGRGDLVASAPYDLVGDLWRGRTYVMSGTSLAGRPLEDAQLGVAGFTFDGECGRRRGLDLPISRVHSESMAKVGNGDLAGFRVAGVGDMNGDGLGDYAVSAPNHGDRDEGTVYVIFGRADHVGIDGEDLFERDCGFGAGVAGNDGHPIPPEIAVPGVLSGRAGFAVYRPNEPLANASPFNWGKHLAPAGDFNGDGYDDLLVPTPGLSARSNASQLVFGGPALAPVPLTGHTTTTHWEIFLGDFRGENGQIRGRLAAGFPSGGGGDMNGDGFDDLAFAGMDTDRGTFLNVLYGRASDDDGIIRTEESVATTWGAGLGFAVSGSVDLDSEIGVVRIVGDVNGDGFDDVAFGAPTHGNPDKGGVFVVFGAALPPTNASLANLRAGVGGFTIETAELGTQLGFALDGGDVDGDGLDDLVIGAPRFAGTNGEAEAGRVIVSYGRDLSGVITAHGGPGSDVLSGSVGVDTLVGGRGDDVLVGHGGADVLLGGAGDDTLRIDGDGWRRVRGGAGEDTLVLGPAVSGLGLAAARGTIRDIERLRLSGQAVTLTTRAIAALSETSHRLVVEGHGAVLTAAGDFWREAGTISDGGASFIVLVDDTPRHAPGGVRTDLGGRAELWLATTLTTHVPPTIVSDRVVVPEASEARFDLVALDPDGPEAALRWTLVTDPSGGLAIDAHGALSVVDPSAFDYEPWSASATPFRVEVAATDAAGLVTVAAIAVTLADVDEPPVFVGTAHFAVEEGADLVLGSVAAIDQDLDDQIAYAIVDDPAGLFAIDPASGRVTLRPGAALDYETANRHQIIVEARDESDLATTLAVTVDVRDRDVLERALRVTFEARDRSIWADAETNVFPGFGVPGLTDQDVTATCLSQAEDDAHTSETTSFDLVRGLPALPIRVEGHYLGTICTRNELTYDSGTWNATVPVDLTLSLPDEVHAGDTITIGSSATPVSDGAALWGSTTSIEMSWELELDDFGIYYAFCDDTITGSCAVAVDEQGLDGTFRDRWGSPSTLWTVGLLDRGDGGFVLGTAEPVVGKKLVLDIDWDAYVFQALTLLGLPSNKGRLDLPVNDDLKIRLDYTILQTSAAFQADNEWEFTLTYRGVRATVTLENGDTHAFVVGTPYALQVPADADVDGDGTVGMAIAFTLESDFDNAWHHRESAGYLYTGGFGRLRAMDASARILAEKKTGPAFEQVCAPKLGANVPSGNVLYCYGSLDEDRYTFTSSGFSTPELIGGIDLAP